MLLTRLETASFGMQTYQLNGLEMHKAITKEQNIFLKANDITSTISVINTVVKTSS